MTQLFEQATRPIDSLYSPSGQHLDVLAVGVASGQRRHVNLALKDESLSVEYVEVDENNLPDTRKRIEEVLAGRTPRRILCFGGQAAHAVCGHGFNALRCREAWELDSHGTPIFHLPYLFNVRENRIIRQWMYEDVAKAMAGVPKYNLPEYTYHLVTCEEQAEHVLFEGLAGRPYELDTETFGPQHHPGHTVVVAAICGVGDRQVFVFDFDAYPETRDAFAAFLNAYPELCCFHNGSYDISAVKEDEGLQAKLGPTCFMDTYIGARLRQGDGDAGLDIVGGLIGLCGHKNEMDEALDECCSVIKSLRKARSAPVVISTTKVTKLNKNGKSFSRTVPDQTRPPDQAEQRQQILDAWNKERQFRKEKTSFRKIYGELTERWFIAVLSDFEPRAYAYALVNRNLCRRYCAMDVAVGAELVPVLRPFAIEQSAAVWRDSLQYAPWACARMEQVGLLMDLQKRQELEDYLDDEIRQKREAIEAYLPGVDINSDEQLAIGLYDTLKLKCYVRTEKTKARSVGKPALAKLAGAHPVIELIQEYNSLNTLQSNYARGLLPFVTPYSRVHTHFNIMGADSGRMSSSDPNLQVLPKRGKRSKLIKGVFVAPPGYWIVEIDYGKLELCIMALLSRDPVLLDLIVRGVDLHREGARTNALEIWKVVWEDLNEEEQDRYRTVFKEILFGSCYGQSAKGLSARFGLTEQQAERIQRYCTGRYKVLAKFINQTGIELAKTGEVWTWWDGQKGRRRPVPDVGSSDQGTAGHGDRAGKNTVVQGTGHEFLLASTSKVIRWVDKDEVDAQVMLDVHDALYALVAEDSLNEFVRGACRIMLGWNSNGLPLTVEVKKGRSLGEMETVDHLALMH